MFVYRFELKGTLIKIVFIAFFLHRVIHCKPFTSLEPVNCPTEFTDFSGPFQLIMWKKMMHVLHTSKFTLHTEAWLEHSHVSVAI